MPLASLQFPGMLSTRVLGNFLTDNAFLGITAVGMTFVILSGGIDLSVGAVIGFTGVLVAVLISWFGIHPLLAFAIALLVAALSAPRWGRDPLSRRCPAFIVTLAGMFLARGGASVHHAGFRADQPRILQRDLRHSTARCPAAAGSA